MTYQVLARKWRPQTFAEMVGQTHVVKALTNAIDNDRLHHAYLFTGTRGVGKTTVARVLAKALNCEKGLSSTPCLTCDTCQAIERGDFLDLQEIDAASRTKVEDTRELLDNVIYRPTVGRYKIYLIDEVHMLSTHSFNALLKTLEEPPAYVIFILATTDSHKVPVTVLSRCLQFTLKHLTPEQISGQLEAICQAEKISVETPALTLLAEAANGSMRDALSLLDQAIAYCDGQLTDDGLKQMLGMASKDVVVELLQRVAADDGEQLFADVSELAEQGVDYVRLLDEMVNTLYQLSLYQCIGSLPTSIPNQAFVALATTLSKETTQLYYQIALKGREDLSISPSQRTGFEMTLLRLLAFRPQTAAPMTTPSTPSAVKAPVKKTAPKIPTQTTPVAPAPNVDPEPLSAPVESATSGKRVEPSVTTAPAVTLTVDTDDWHALVTRLTLSGMAKTVLSHCVLLKKTEDKLELGLDKGYHTMLTKPVVGRIEEALCKALSRRVSVKFNESVGEKATPAMVTKAKREAYLQSAKVDLKNDPQLNNIIEQFDAKIDEDSIQLTDETI